MKSFVQKLGVGLLVGSPLIAFAQIGNITTTLGLAAGWAQTAGTIVVSLTFVYFVWGLIQYLLGDESSKEAARTKMITSVLIMFVVFSIWGLVSLLASAFGATDDSSNSLALPSAT